MRILFAVILIFTATTSNADQFLIPNVRESQDLFWTDVYPNEGWSLYCGEFFESHKDIKIEYIYPMPDVAAFINCGTVEECRMDSGQFNRIEADLHNLYPALKLIIMARSNYHYGKVAGEFREFFECDFEQDVREKLVEPRPIARGNIARAMLYMYTEYQLPLTPQELIQFKDWHKADQPSKDEKRRNDVIEKLQGTRNIYIDKPELAEEIKMVQEKREDIPEAILQESF